MPRSSDIIVDTALQEYTARLQQKSSAWWKVLLSVQLPYRLHVRSLKLGKCLDIGCGIGRLLKVLPQGSLGIDHNEHSVALCEQQGLRALTVDQFWEQQKTLAEIFDSFMLAHVCEHMTPGKSEELLSSLLQFLRPGGRVVLVCPQESGYRSDASHVTWMDFDGLAALSQRVGLQTVRQYSFPFPRLFGRWFRYNEFVVIAEK
jgi:2-polyprenyl-3-methyl-5-hydroxy-6-metoxy-1,4-benzoquinol methylase